MKILSTVLRLFARLHCGLIAAILSSAAFSMLATFLPVSLSPYAAFWRGLLFAIPTALCCYAIKRLPSLWQFLLCGVGLCALSWLLMGHPGGAGLMALMCLFRIRIRLAEEEEGPIPSFFDQPALPVLSLFAAVWVLSAIMALTELQKISLLGGVLYLVLCLADHSLARVEAYLRLNKDMHGLPAQRIRRIAGSAAIASVALTAVLLLPLAISDSGALRIQLPDGRGNAPLARYEETEAPTGETDGNPPMNPDLSDLAGEPSWQIPEWVSYILFGIAGVLGAIALYAGVRGLIKNFRLSFSDNRDVIQRLERGDRDKAEQLGMELRRPRFFDRSPGANVRRRYRRAILRAGKESPKPWHTPEELESAAGLNEPELHKEYERVRYGRVE